MRDAAGEVIYMERIPAAVVEQALVAAPRPEPIPNAKNRRRNEP